MINFTVLCMGRLREGYLREASAEYKKRLGAFCKINEIELAPARLSEKPSPSEISAALKEEEKRLISKIPDGARVYSLCIEGRQLSSEALSTEIEQCALRGNGNFCFIIGSSYGLSEGIKKLSNERISMSAMTFPHQLARIMLLEQLYRALSISGNGKYHK